MNTVTVSGNITRDPEVKVFPSGKKITTFSIAVNRRVGEEEFVSYYDINAWEKLGENCASLPKGARVLVSGRLEQRSWEDKEGNKRSRVEIVATEVAASLLWATVDIHTPPSNYVNEESYEKIAPASSNKTSSKASAPKEEFSTDLDEDFDPAWD